MILANEKEVNHIFSLLGVTDESKKLDLDDYLDGFREDEFSLGYDDGYDSGASTGYEDGFADGREEARAEFEQNVKAEA